MTPEEFATLQVGDEVMFHPGGYAHLQLTKVTRRTDKSVWIGKNERRVWPSQISRRATDADRRRIRLEWARDVLRRCGLVGAADDETTIAFAEELEAVRARWRDRAAAPAAPEGGQS